MTDQPPEIPRRPARRSLWQRLSIVWLIPLAALLIALGVAWQSWSQRGPLIEVAFEQASGIQAGNTQLRFRDVSVGVVEELGFSDSLGEVVARIRLQKDLAPFVDDGARFWVVQPEVTAQGVSGLETVLSGVFIEGVWDNDPGGLVTRHQGLASAPLLRAGESGLRLRLVAGTGAALTEGAPILYKGIKVGRIGAPELSGDGAVAEASAVILAPYDRLVTTATRFWDASGFSFSLGSAGAQLDFSSLASLVSGGVSFATIVSGGVPVQDGARFELFSDESTARASLFADNLGPPLNVTVVFQENVGGLSVGAPVELGGVQIGEVANLSGAIDPQQYGDDAVRLLATLAIRPSRLGLSGETGPEEALGFLAQRVSNGLRARLASVGLLSGGLKIELVDVDDPEPAAMDLSAVPFPTLPSTESDIADVAATAQGVMQRVNDLPIEEVMASAIRFLDTATELAGNDALGRVPAEAEALLAEMRGLLGSEALQALPAQAGGLVAELDAAAGDLRGILAELETARTVERLLAAVDAAAAAARGVETGTEGVPALIDELTAVAAQARELPLDTLTAELRTTVASARALLELEGTRALPEALGGALAEVEAALAELRAGGAVAAVNDTLGAASRAAQAVETAAAELPALTARVDALLVQADAALSGFAPNSELGRSARAALREVQEAATAVESLSRTLERRPNSIILGR